VQAVRALKRRLRHELVRARRGRADVRVFIEVFAGTGRVAASFRRRGAAALTLELSDDVLQDVTLDALRRLLVSWTHAGIIKGMWLGTPCSSWSSARRRRPGAPRGALRTRAAILGHPEAWARPRDAQRLADGNRTARTSAQLIQACVQAGCPVILETPSGSLLWAFPPLARLCRLSCSASVTLDQCRFGSLSRKRTRLQAWHAGNLEPLRRLCCGKEGRCSTTGEQHVILEGKLTWASSRYPSAFAAAAAGYLDNFLETTSLQVLWNHSLGG